MAPAIGVPSWLGGPIQPAAPLSSRRLETVLLLDLLLVLSLPLLVLVMAELTVVPEPEVLTRRVRHTQITSACGPICAASTREEAAPPWSEASRKAKRHDSNLKHP